MEHQDTATFHSWAYPVDSMTERKGEEVRYEPMLFNALGSVAYELGGPITREFIDKLCLPHERDTFVFDSRVHMLFPGWFPCIPGFHHDDVPRYRDDGQPLYEEFGFDVEEAGVYPERPFHVAALVGDDISRTQFALGKADFEYVPKGKKFYQEWHPIVEQKLADGELEEYVIPMHKMIHFNDRSWHQGVQSTGSGWRWFGRAAFACDRLKNPANELRRQVQVYMPAPMEGW